MRAYRWACAATVLLAACSTHLETGTYGVAPDAVPNVTVYLSDQRPTAKRVALSVYVDDRFVARHAPAPDIHAHHEIRLRLPPGPHRVEVRGPEGASATKEIVVGSVPLFLSAAWWSTDETSPITLEVYEGEMPGFC